MPFHVVAGVLQHASHRVADDGVARPPDVDRAGRVGARVFDDDARLTVFEVAVVVFLCRFEGPGEIGIAREEIDVGPLCPDGVDVGQVGGVDGIGHLPGDFRRGCAGLAGEPVGHARRQHGIDIAWGLFDTEVVGREIEGRECPVKGVLDFRPHREEHIPHFPAPDIGVTGSTEHPNTVECAHNARYC